MHAVRALKSNLRPCGVLRQLLGSACCSSVRHVCGCRLNHYAGHGFDQDEMARFLQAKHDWGHQLGYAMGGYFD